MVSVHANHLISENVYSFDGSENMLRIARTYNIQFLCAYNLKWYPFDTQVSFYCDGSESDKSQERTDLLRDSIELIYRAGKL